MRIWDMHCDVLSKLIMDEKMDFERDPQLDVTAERLREGGVKLQNFAIFIPGAWRGCPFDAVLASIDAFRRRIASDPAMMPVLAQKDLEVLSASPGHIGAMISLEGAEGLEGNMMYLRIIHALGVRTLGLTWNHANWAADGILEPRGGGLTRRGRLLIDECNKLGMVLDVSHLSVRGFWELMERQQGAPPIASHSNAKALCSHPRNLDDEQIRALIEADGRIGITFVPFFLRNDGQASIDDVLHHLDHICALGGAAHVAFGSDFDGIETWTRGLEHAGKYAALAEQLERRYSASETEGFLQKNWLSYYKRHLPI